MGIAGTTQFLLFSVLLLMAAQSQEMNSESDSLQSFLVKCSGQRRSYDLAKPVCSWPGIGCSQQGQILNLSEPNAGLRCLIIPEQSLGKLQHLEYLDLQGNHISALPSDFWGLNNLTVVNLSHNNLSGPLPNNVANFAKLTVLDLSSNSFSGPLPPNIGSLLNLRHLNLSRNMFNGSLPDQIFGLKQLVELDLSHNLFSGRVPPGSSGLLFLETLSLAENRLQGQIQDLGFLQVSPLFYLNISSNLFTGELGELANLKSLTVVDLSNNAFTGSVDAAAVSGLPRISVLRLRMNNLSGELSFLSWSTLRELDVSRNLFESWTIDTRVSMPSLSFLDLSANRMTGPIPPNMQLLTTLQHLNLAGNNFVLSGVPDLGLFRELVYLNLSSCRIKDSIPASFVKLPQLRVLDISKNNFSGTIPDPGHGTWQALAYLDFSVNNLVGIIPSDLLSRLSSMAHFNFSYNNVTFCESYNLVTKFPAAFIGLTFQCPVAVNPTAVGNRDNRKSNLALAVGIALGCFLLGLLSLTCFCSKRVKMIVKHMSSSKEQSLSGPFSFEADSYAWATDVRHPTAAPVVMFEKPLLNLTFADLLSATNRFSRDTLLAEGRYGPVYGAVLLGGFHVAIKVLVNDSSLSDQEAASVFEQLGRIKHPNLIPMLGYCIAGDKRLAIYEFMENGNVHHWLHDLPLGTSVTESWAPDAWDRTQSPNSLEGTGSGSLSSALEWKVRHMIALGTARALAFLHHGCCPPVVHRDVKSSSIYLDAELTPYLADFGLERIVSAPPRVAITDISGYDPPEYRETSSAATSKGDVYNFGVVLFELVTGKKPVNDNYSDTEETTLVGWMRNLVKVNSTASAVDPKLSGALAKQIQETLRIAYLCTAESPMKRPTMQQIVGLLKDMEPVLQHQGNS